MVLLIWTSITSSAEVLNWLQQLKTAQYLLPESNSGATWTAQPGSGNRAWTSIGSADGTKLTATVNGGSVYVTDSGVTTEQAGSGNRAWTSITGSAMVLSSPRLGQWRCKAHSQATCGDLARTSRFWQPRLDFNHQLCRRPNWPQLLLAV